MCAPRPPERRRRHRQWGRVRPRGAEELVGLQLCACVHWSCWCSTRSWHLFRRRGRTLRGSGAVRGRTGSCCRDGHGTNENLLDCGFCSLPGFGYGFLGGRWRTGTNAAGLERCSARLMSRYRQDHAAKHGTTCRICTTPAMTGKRCPTAPAQAHGRQDSPALQPVWLRVLSQATEK